MKVRRSLVKYRGETCLNCGHPLKLTERFCSRCGQMNSTKKLSFNDFFAEFFSGLFSYDSRFQRTLRVLLFKPGKISRDFISGKRMRYANPFRFYLSASILFFLLFGLTVDFGKDFTDRDNLELVNSNQGLILRPPQAELDSINRIITGQGLDSIKIDTTSLSYKDKYLDEAQLDSMNFFNGTGKRLELYFSFQDETHIRNSERAIDSLKHDHSRFNHWLYKKVVDIDTFRDEPGLFIDYFLSKLPFIIFFYLPVFALFIWLLYLRRPFNYMEHLIFAFHTQTMFFVLYGIALLLQEVVGGKWAINLAHVVFLFYLYKGMRNFYGQGRVKTIIKFILLNLIFFILAIIAAIISLLASFSIY